MSKASRIMIPNNVFSILEKQLQQYELNDNNVCYDLFEGAINKMDLYKKQIEARGSELPQREKIGIACFWLLLLSNADECAKFWNTVIKIMDASQGISLYQLLPEVIELASYAEDLVETSVRNQGKLNNSDHDLF